MCGTQHYHLRCIYCRTLNLRKDIYKVNSSENKPVFLQIKVWIEDHILRGEWSTGTQLPSVRELSVRFGVNNNTVVRTYERMLFDGSVHSVRGVGFFVADNARDMIIARRRDEFYTKTLPTFVKQMELLGVGMLEVVRAYDENKKKENNDDTKKK